MPVPTIPSAISASSIQTEFGGSNPISLSEYYSGGSNVPAGTANATGVLIPSSPGTLRFSNFSGAQKIVSVSLSLTVGVIDPSGGGYEAYRGYYSGLMGSVSSSSIIGGRTLVTLYDWYIFNSYQTTVVEVSGNQTGTWWSSINWTYSGYTTTVSRTSSGTYDSGSNTTIWYENAATLFLRNSSTISSSGDTGTITFNA